ncbi:preprotein translocase subunit SecE [Mycobacterium helveticum]|uniref:Protein translocase subunit SecE n=1 Tax=Mycobacterium helveticum TaxID=2592811 RepID=A0A557XKN1_9MYCO|nr:preprotein translocase subunit SecE [Mycobacterium helveticum]TVS85611.1 preprotein translocase subunit SecE [Mycobacterium helveticum]TVS86343.1 preprotein translocase subunit SecE [Mycobacterium helveticum]
MSDEKDVADDAARDGGESGESRGSGGRTAVATQAAARPQRPTGKRSRQRAEDAAGAARDESSAEPGKDKGKDKKVPKGGAGKARKTTQAGSSANPFVFVYNYLKQVVAEMRKVIWPNRKQMLTYTSVVLVFLAFMVALVGLADFGLTKLVLLVFG